MALYDNKSQKGKAQENMGREQAKMAREGYASGQKLSNKDRIKLAAAGARNQMEGRMALNRLKKNQHTDSNN